MPHRADPVLNRYVDWPPPLATETAINPKGSQNARGTKEQVTGQIRRIEFSTPCISLASMPRRRTPFAPPRSRKAKSAP